MSGYLSDKLQKLQNRAARVITKSPFDTSSNHLLSTLDWERLSLRRKKQKALMMYKTMNDLAPEYLQSLFSQRHSAYNLRNSEGRLTLSKPSTNYLKRSFSYSGAMLWNNLPKSLKNAASVTGRPESQEPTGSQIIRICLEIYLKIDRMVKMYKNSFLKY